MKKGFKLLIFMAIAIALIIVRASFLPLELNERAIVLGVGVDYDENIGEYNVAVVPLAGIV